MANAIINVDVNDSQFKTLLTNAEKYKKAVESSNKAWKTASRSASQLNTQIKYQANLYKQVFAGMAKYVANDVKSLVNNQKRNNLIKHQISIHKQVLVGMGKYIAYDMKALANGVRRNVQLGKTLDYTRRIAMYAGGGIGRVGRFIGGGGGGGGLGGGLGGAMGSGFILLFRAIGTFVSTALRFMRMLTGVGLGVATAGFFGAKGLTQTASDTRRRSLEVGASGGQLRASRFVYGRYFDVDAPLSAIQNAQKNPDDRRILTGLNFENQNPTEVLPQLIDKFVNIYQRDPRNAVANLKSAGIEDSGFTFENIAQMARLPESERLQARADFEKKSKEYKIGDDDLKIAQDLNQKFIDLTNTIQNKLIDAILQFEPQIKEFTDILISFVQSISKDDIKNAYNDFVAEIQKFVTTLKKINAFIDDPLGRKATGKAFADIVRPDANKPQIPFNVPSKKDFWSGGGDLIDNYMREKMGSKPKTVTQEQVFGKINTYGQMESAKHIVLHHTGGRSVEGAMGAFKERGTGTQYIVDQNGNITQLAPENAITRHVTPNKGITNANSIGIEFVGKNDADITDIQKIVGAKLVKEIRERNPSINQVIGHGEQAPAGHRQLTEGSSVLNFIRSANEIKVTNASGASLNVTSSVLQ
jgi:hypothetical protein